MAHGQARHSACASQTVRACERLERGRTSQSPGGIGATMTDKKKPHTAGTDTAQKTTLDSRNSTPPTVTGQCAEVLSLIRQYPPLLSFVLTADHAIPEAAARVHDLRGMGFNILTTIKPAVEFRGVTRRNAALYSLGSPEWPAPGFFAEEVQP